jgi:hypothetical protein
LQQPQFKHLILEYDGRRHTLQCLQLRLVYVEDSLMDVKGRPRGWTTLHAQRSCPPSFGGTTRLVWLQIGSTLISTIKPKHTRVIRDCTQEVPKPQNFNTVFFCLQHQFTVHLMTPLATKLVKNLLSKLDVCLRFFAAIELTSAAISRAHYVRMHRTMNLLGCSP